MNPYTHLTNAELVARLKEKVRAERETLVDILNLLREVEARKLYLEMGLSSLYAFAIQELGYSESAALRRIDAMRLSRNLPEIQEKIKLGAVNLSTLEQLNQYIRAQEKTKNERVSVKEKKDLLTQIEGHSIRETRDLLVKLSPELAPVRQEKERPITEELVEIKIVVTRAQLDKLERVRELQSHVNVSATKAQLIEQLMDFYLARKDPALKQLRPETPKPPAYSESCLGTINVSSVTQAQIAPPLRRRNGQTRYIPRAAYWEVRKKHGDQCTYFDPITKRRCNSKHRLEIEHILPFARGGTHDPSNLTLLCPAHNKLAAWKVYGVEKMQAHLPDWKS